jgi:glycerol-3-phosphate dehydrogenase
MEHGFSHGDSSPMYDVNVQPPFTRHSRRDHLARLRQEVWDVLILGGGINGAGVARDLALREPGLKIALVEKRHFASGTSGKNSQLIHGGLRYLKNFEMGLVRESLHERSTLLRIAPHLVTPLKFVIPMYGWSARLFYGTGLFLYDLLAGSRNVGKHTDLSRNEVERLEPGLAREGLTSAGVYYDCRIQSSRFVLENVFDAARRDAAVVNYCEASGYTRGGDVFSVAVLDALSGDRFQARARHIVDCMGPWSANEPLRLVRGSHILLPNVLESDHAIAHFEEAGRIVFVIPWWGGELCLVGTTDIDHDGSPDDVRISRAEVDYLMRIVRRLFPNSAAEPVSGYSSLRPLLLSNDASPTKTSREHRIWQSADGVLHVAGGKYTTYRAMADETVCHLSSRPCVTETTPLPDSAPPQLTVEYAVEHEMAQRLPDYLFGSTYLGYERPECIREFGREMAAICGWNEARLSEEVNLSRRICALPD